MANLQIRIDDDLRIQAQQVAQSMGLDLASSVRLFLTQMVRHNGLPFTPKADPFYSERNQLILQDSIAQLERGEGITKTMAELEAMES